MVVLLEFIMSSTFCISKVIVCFSKLSCVVFLRHSKAQLLNKTRVPPYYELKHVNLVSSKSEGLLSNKREEMLKVEPKSKDYGAEQCPCALEVIQSPGASRS